MFTDEEILAQAIINSRLMLAIKALEQNNAALAGRIKELEGEAEAPAEDVAA